MSATRMDAVARFAVIARLVERLKSAGVPVNKTAVQKYVYFLEEAGLPVGYKYGLHYYGAYSADLASDADYMGSIDLLDITPDDEGYGFHIDLGKRAEKLDSLTEEGPSQQIRRALDKVVETLHGKKVKDLELLSTLHLVAAELKRRGEPPEDERIVKIVKRLKPGFKEGTIRDELEFLKGTEFRVL